MASGELLAGMEKHNGARDGKTGSHDATPLLSDIGINKTQSSRWQKIAAIPDEQFETTKSEATTSRVTDVRQPTRGIGRGNCCGGAGCEGTAGNANRHCGINATRFDRQDTRPSRRNLRRRWAAVGWALGDGGGCLGVYGTGIAEFRICKKVDRWETDCHRLRGTRHSRPVIATVSHQISPSGNTQSTRAGRRRSNRGCSACCRRGGLKAEQTQLP